jgi:hypothetical protein
MCEDALSESQLWRAWKPSIRYRLDQRSFNRAR